MSGCVWNPSEDRYGTVHEAHYNEAPATVMLGSGDRQHLLCESCSRLPRFSRLRKRVELEPRDCPAPSRQPHGRHEWYCGFGANPLPTICHACGKIEGS